MVPYVGNPVQLAGEAMLGLPIVAAVYEFEEFWIELQEVFIGRDVHYTALEN